MKDLAEGFFIIFKVARLLSYMGTMPAFI